MASSPPEPLLFGLFHAISHPRWVPLLSAKANVCWNKMRLCVWCQLPTKCSVLVRHNTMQTNTTHQLIATNQFQTTTHFNFSSESRCLLDASGWNIELCNIPTADSVLGRCFHKPTVFIFHHDITINVYNRYKCLSTIITVISLFCVLPRNFQ